MPIDWILELKHEDHMRLRVITRKIMAEKYNRPDLTDAEVDRIIGEIGPVTAAKRLHEVVSQNLIA